MVPLTITASLDTQTVGLIEHPFMLDGPLAWVVWQRAGGRPLLTGMPLEDIDLPLERWNLDGVWGWCTSAARYEIAGYSALQLRKKPTLNEYARFTTDRRFHAALGPHKARDTTTQTAHIRTATWHVNATDRAAVEDLLGSVTRLGKHHGIGLGNVNKWTVTDHDDADAWRDRPLPDPAGQPMPVRAPYWHPSLRHPCRWEAA